MAIDGPWPSKTSLSAVASLVDGDSITNRDLIIILIFKGPVKDKAIGTVPW